MIPNPPGTAVDALEDMVHGQNEQSYVQCIADDGVYEVFTIQAAAFASTAQGDYCSFTEPTASGETFAVWLDKNANGTTPTGAVYTAATRKVKASITTGQTAAQVAAAIKTALEADTHFDLFTIAISNDTLTITANKHGTATDAAAHNTGDTGAGSLTVAVTTQGVASTLNNKKFTLHDGADSAYYVWMNVNSQGVDPTGTGTAIAALISTGATAAQVATAVALAVDNDSHFDADADGSRVKITNEVAGNSTDVDAGNSGFTVLIEVQGHAATSPGPDTATSSLTNF